MKRTIIRNRIRRGSQTIEVIPALFIRLELSAEVELLLVRILLLVQSVCRRLPHLHGGAHQWLLSGKIDDTTMHEGHLTIRDPLDDVIAVLAVGGVGAEEWAQDSSGSGSVIGFFGEFESDFVHEA